VNIYKQFLPLLLLSAAVLPALGQTTPKKTTLNAVATRAAATPAIVPGASQFTTYNFNWSYVANLPECVSTNNACYDGFVMTNTTLGTVVGAVSQIGPSALSYTYSPANGIPFGSTNFSLVAHGFDSTGKSINSTPATVAIVVAVSTLNGPTGLQVKNQ
jgi:hypothetical protein